MIVMPQVSQPSLPLQIKVATPTLLPSGSLQEDTTDVDCNFMNSAGDPESNKKQWYATGLSPLYVQSNYLSVPAWPSKVSQ